LGGTVSWGECLGGEFLLVGWVLGGDLLAGLLGLGVMFLVGEGEKEALTKVTVGVLVGDSVGVRGGG
jgi:hypothetical protein